MIKRSLKKASLLIVACIILSSCMSVALISCAYAIQGLGDAKISLDFIDIKTADLLKLLADHSHKSIVLSEKVDSKITIKLHDISWREALNAVLQMHGYVKYETPSTITVLTADESEKNPNTNLNHAIFGLRHVSAENVSKILKPGVVLSPQGKSEAEVGTNSLVVADTSDKIMEVKELLKQVDLPAKQVLIEARIVNADKHFLHELGFELHNTKASGNKTKIDVTNSLRGQFDFTLAKFASSNLLDLRLAALEDSGRGKVISKPKLLASDREEAYIEAGAEIPYQEKTKSGNTSISFKKAVLSLKVIPEVIGKTSVNLNLQLNQDKVGQFMVNGVPTIDTRKIQTHVLVRDGETIVLGGIYEWSKIDQITSVPVLGKIPIIKILFSKRETRLERKELLIFVTPKILPF